MAGDDIDEDEYVARLLKQDALDASKKYGSVGLDAFHPKRLRADAPKPNTSFLRHIIRQTDSHNAALRAKETKDSRARLRELDRAEDSAHDRRRDRRGGSHSPDRGDRTARRDRKDRHRLDSTEEQDRRSYKKSRHEEERRTTRSRRDRSREEGRRHHHRHGREKAERSAHRSSHRRQREYRSGDKSVEADSPRHTERSSRKRVKQRSRSRSSTRSPTPTSSGHHKVSKHYRRSRSPRRRSRSPVKQTSERESTREPRASARQSPTSEDESDPLEVIVGPLPPPKQPTVRSRGRGAHKSDASGINARFSSVYDPVMDVGSLSDNGDEWGDAVEAFRDRQRWKQQGAERLKAAGFSEEQVKKWERGDEKTEEDVKWAALGQAREWDRGKVVDADGDVGIKATWTRI